MSVLPMKSWKRVILDIQLMKDIVLLYRLLLRNSTINRCRRLYSVLADDLFEQEWRSTKFLWNNVIVRTPLPTWIISVLLKFPNAQSKKFKEFKEDVLYSHSMCVLFQEHFILPVYFNLNWSTSSNYIIKIRVC